MNEFGSGSMKKINIINYTILSMTIFSFIMLLFYVNRLNIIPLRYCYIFTFLDFFLILFSLIFNKFDSKIINYIGMFIAVVVLLMNSFGIYYVKHLDKFLDNGFTGDIVRSSTYYLVTSKNNSVDKIDDVAFNSNVYYFNLGDNKDEAFAKVGNYNYMELDEMDDFFIGSINSDNYLLVEKNNYNLVFNEVEGYSQDNFKVIYEFDIKTSTKRNEEVKDVYNVLIIGKDFGNRNDLTLLATVNTRSRKVLLTSFQRDYYIPTHGTPYSDTICLMTLLGDDVVVKSIGDYLNITIDYSITLYTDNIVEIVDKIGGIEFCSDQAFTTTHAKVLGTYDDSKGEKVHIRKGCQHLNGIETLTVARERLVFKTADRKRQENCRKILMSILRKIIDGSTLLNYTSVLDSFNGLYQTDLNRTVITSLIRDLISDGEYEVVEQLADGYNTMGRRQQNKWKGYVTYPDEELTKKIKAKIKSVMAEK